MAWQNFFLCVLGGGNIHFCQTQIMTDTSNEPFFSFLWFIGSTHNAATSSKETLQEISTCPIFKHKQNNAITYTGSNKWNQKASIYHTHIHFWLRYSMFTHSHNTHTFAIDLSEVMFSEVVRLYKTMSHKVRHLLETPSKREAAIIKDCGAKPVSNWIKYERTKQLIPIPKF